MNHFNFQKSVSDFKNQVDWVGLRYYRESGHSYYVRNENPERDSSQLDQGVMIEVLVDGHLGYAATSDLTPDGLKQAFQKAKGLSKHSASHKAAGFSVTQRPPSRGTYRGPYLQHIDSLTTEEVFGTLMKASKNLKVSEKIVARHAAASLLDTQIHYISSSDAEWEQNFNLVTTHFQVTAQNAKESQTRTTGNSAQKGAEVLRDPKIFESCHRIGQEALELL
jgi:predicted Zn-dependent protease